jgi:hypothetical protein
MAWGTRKDADGNETVESGHRAAILVAEASKRVETARAAAIRHGGETSLLSTTVAAVQATLQAAFKFAAHVIASRSCGEAIQGRRTTVGAVALDCFVASLLAMTRRRRPESQGRIRRRRPVEPGLRRPCRH